MITLGRIEYAERGNLGDNRVVPHMIGRQLGYHFVGGLLLLGGIIEDRGTILRSDIRPLPVERGGIMNGEEHIEQIAVGDHFGVERYLHRLGMSRFSGADLFVGGVQGFSPGISRLHLLHAPKLIERRLHAPEAAAGKGRNFQGAVGLGHTGRRCVLTSVAGRMLVAGGGGLACDQQQGDDQSKKRKETDSGRFHDSFCKRIRYGPENERRGHAVNLVIEDPRCRPYYDSRFPPIIALPPLHSHLRQGERTAGWGP